MLTTILKRSRSPHHGRRHWDTPCTTSTVQLTKGGSSDGLFQWPQSITGGEWERKQGLHFYLKQGRKFYFTINSTTVKCLCESKLTCVPTFCLARHPSCSKRNSPPSFHKVWSSKLCWNLSHANHLRITGMLWRLSQVDSLSTARS